MEIKCKVSFTLPEELVDALELTDDTPIIACLLESQALLLQTGHWYFVIYLLLLFLTNIFNYF